MTECTQQYISTANSVVVCISQASVWGCKGILYHGYSTVGTSFFSYEQILFIMDELFNELNFPYPDTVIRKFKKQKRKAYVRKERIKVMKDEELLEKHGPLGTFIIRVQHRQNSSWQGRITWVESEKSVYFRSIWEMINLLESAMDKNSLRDDGPIIDWQD